MTRRAVEHDYSAPGIYHITISVADGLGHPLGRVMGCTDVPDGNADAPHVVLSPLGKKVEDELLHSIPRFYPMMEIQDYVIMPEHLHFIIEAHSPIVTLRGLPSSLGQVIAGFKKGCNRHFWAMAQQPATSNTHRGKPDGANPATAPADTPAPVGTPGSPASVSGPASVGTPASASVGTPAAASVGAPASASVGTPASASVGTPASAFVGAPAVSPQVSPLPSKVPSRASTGRQPLFAPNYCDVMPLQAGQLAAQRAYIRSNPRNRLLRMQNRATLSVHRAALSTAVTIPALIGYLRRECRPADLTSDTLAALLPRLLTAPAPAVAQRGKPVDTNPVGTPAVSPQVASADPAPIIVCDLYGDRSLLSRRLLPVVCHRRDAAQFAKQKAACIQAAASGAVLVSARIAKGEQAIIDEVTAAGHPVVRISDNGFPDIFHPSAEQQTLCAAGRLLLVSPWNYAFRHKDEAIHVAYCKTMNCIAQALCRTKDSWWMTQYEQTNQSKI